MTNLEKRRADRFRFLKRLYEVTDANKFAMGNVEEIARELGVDSDEADKIVQYLEGKGWLEWRSMGLVSITEWGIDEVERALSGMEAPVDSEESLATKQDEDLMADERALLACVFSPEEREDLTGLGRRSVFERDIEQFVLASKARRMPVSCLMIDIDDFKQINDTHGHPAGDEVLKAVAFSIGAVVHGKGRAYRYGGEEFAALLYNFASQEAAGVANRIRETVADLKIPGIERPVTVSVGVCVYPDFAAGGTELVQEADQALLEGKRAGKNATIVHDTEREKRQAKARPGAAAEEIDRILRWFDSTDAVVRKDAARELHQLIWRKSVSHYPPIKAWVSRLLKDPGEEVRMEALEIVRVLVLYEREGVLGDYYQPLVDTAEADASVGVRARAMAVIGATGDPSYLEHVYAWIAKWDQQTYSRVQPIAALTGLTHSGLGERIRNDLRALVDRAVEPARQRYVEALKNVSEMIR